MIGMFPLVTFDTISHSEMNDCLRQWGHRMGAFERPNFGAQAFHGLRHNDTIVAVTATARLIPEVTAGLTRDDAFALAAARPDLNRVALRLWREFCFPAICSANGWQWCISYQDAVIHSGDLYRFDGWVRLGYSASGTDARSGKRGRRKWIWGWHADRCVRNSRKIAA